MTHLVRCLPKLRFAVLLLFLGLGVPGGMGAGSQGERRVVISFDDMSGGSRLLRYVCQSALEIRGLSNGPYLAGAVGVRW